MYELDLKKLLDCLPEKYAAFAVEQGCPKCSLVHEQTMFSGIWCDLLDTARQNSTYPPRHSALYLQLHTDKIVLWSIVVTKKNRGGGCGTSVIRELLVQCRQLGLPLHINAAGKTVRAIAYKLSAEFNMVCDEVVCAEDARKKAKCWDIDIK